MKDFLDIRLNIIKILSIESFANIRGGLTQGIKDVYFIRCIGFDNKDQLLADIKKIDQYLKDRAKKRMGGYVRTKELPKLVSNIDINDYITFYNKWISSKKKHSEIRYKFSSNSLHDRYWKALNEIEKIFLKLNEGASDSLIKNFIIKILYWSDLFMPKLFKNWNERITPKFIFSGDIKKQEYLFLYFLVLLGVDVLYLNTEKDLNFEEELMSLSILNKGKIYKKVNIPDYSEDIINSKQNADASKWKSDTNTKTNANSRSNNKTNASNKINDNYNKESYSPITVNLKRDKKKPTILPEVSSVVQRTNSSIEKKELEFEEIAKLASSIVMIGVFDKDGKCIKSGSGMIINKDGFILTNYHVVSEGYSYLVRIEEDDNTYDGSKLIKYNYIQDLALIKINRVCKPVPIYKGDKSLVRGQKVVAIGSPLGLFNSVSNGIISGFRDFDDVRMIQFTAPISRGSSGGALLNMYGEIIGISTAGIDDGQNINLAVDHSNISMFLRGFI